MPIYEYVCQGCEYRFEVKQKINDAPVEACPRCGQPVTKVISAPAIMFKGTGWYVTDYSDKLKPPGQSESPGKPSTEPKKEAASTPSTPAAAAPAGTAAPAPASSSGTSANSSAAPSSSTSTTSSSTPASSSS